MSTRLTASSPINMLRVLVVLTLFLSVAGLPGLTGSAQEARPSPPTNELSPTPESSIPPPNSVTPSPTVPAVTEPAPSSTAPALPTATVPIAAPTATATVEVKADEGTGTLVITTVDEHGTKVAGACFTTTYTTYSPACDAADGASDGVTTIANLPAGFQIYVWQKEVATGYAKAEPVSFILSAGETKNLELQNPHAATIVIHALNGDDQPLPGAAYNLFKDAGGGKLGGLVIQMADSWDGATDGTNTARDLLPGPYVLVETYLPQFFEKADNVLVTLSAGETVTVEVDHTPYSTILVRTEDSEHTPLKGAWYQAFDPESSARNWVASACDGCDGDPLDGTTVLRVPGGTWRIEQYEPPQDYLPSPNQTVSVGERATAEATFTNVAGAVITVHATDVGGTVVPYLSWSLYKDAGGGTRGARVMTRDGNWEGVTAFTPLEAGNYIIEASFTSDVYRAPAPTLVTVTLGEHVELTIAVPEHAPKLTTGPWMAELTQTKAVLQWATDQETVGYVDFGLSQNLGRVRPRTAPAPATFHQVTLDGLAAGTLYYFRIRSTNLNGEVLTDIYSFRTPPVTANATIVIKKVNSSGVALGGTCFDLYTDAGSGKLGTFINDACDRYDTDPDNGTLRINGLKAGTYVLVETRAPTGYALAANARFSVTAGQTKTVTVTDYRGGSTLAITATAGGGESTPGACFSLFKDLGSGRLGTYVAAVCDDYDGSDGVTSFVGLRAGSYVIAEWIVPSGYIRGENLPITIGTRETRSVDFLNVSESNSQLVKLRTADSTGKLIPGACFNLFSTDGSVSLYACDSWDGRNDGQTFFTNVDAGPYSAFETVAPKGYMVGKSTTFTKPISKQVTRTFTQVKGGTAVTVKTLSGATTTPLKGSCYALYKTSTGMLAAVACDDDGTNDGSTSFAGIPAGTYYLEQISTPAGYAKPKGRTITVGTTPASVTVRTYHK